MPFFQICFASSKKEEERQWIIFSTFYSEQNIYDKHITNHVLSLVSVSLLTGISIGITITWSLSKDWVFAFKSFISFTKTCKLRSEICSSLDVISPTEFIASVKILGFQLQMTFYKFCNELNVWRNSVLVCICKCQWQYIIFWHYRK